MKRDSDSYIIPKIIIILGSLSILGIILLFFRGKREIKPLLSAPKPETAHELFAQVMEAARPHILEIWEDGDKFITKNSFNCPGELEFSKNVGRSFYQCQPHFWQCYWQKGIKDDVEIKIDLHGQTFHVRALPTFSPLKVYSENNRFYELIVPSSPEINIKYGYLAQLEVREIPGMTSTILLADSCRDTYLPQRFYAYGNSREINEGEGFIWDNINRNIFIDKFYVTNQRVNEWRILTNEPEKVVKDASLWAWPAIINLEEQKAYCAFFGKRLMEAKLFDAATMTPSELKEPRPQRVLRPLTPWQRDIGKTFLGMSRINEDYQLTPLDCQLAQVQDCAEKHFTTDSATWMGIHFGLGFYPESLVNDIEPKKNLKESSRFLAAASKWHELGLRGSWSGVQDPKRPVAFRCYEEVIP